MLALVEKLTTQGGATRQDVRKETAKPKAGRPKFFVFTFKPPTKAFDLRLSFKKSRVEKDEIITALENIIRELQSIPLDRAGFQDDGVSGLQADQDSVRISARGAVARNPRLIASSESSTNRSTARFHWQFP